MKKTFQITREILDLAKRSSATECPVALCLKGETKVGWFVYWSGSRQHTKPKSVWFDHTDSLQDWIRDWDHNMTSFPIEIWIDEENHLIGRMPQRILNI